MEHRDLHQVPPPDDGHDSAEDPQLVLDAVRDVYDEQRASAERLRTSAQQTFVFVSVLFTIAQTAIFADFGGSGVLSAGEKTWLLILGCGAVAGVGLTGFLAMYAHVLQHAPGIAVSDIVHHVKAVIRQGEPTEYALIELYDQAIRDQQQVIESRRERLRWLSVAAALTVGLTVAEIAVALFVRIP